MRALSWMIGPDIVSDISLACYHSSIQTNIVIRFFDFFVANSYFITFSNISGLLLITRFYVRTVNCIDAPAFTSFISSYFFFHDKICLSVFSDITSSVRNIRNHVVTAALPADYSASFPSNSVPPEVSRHRSPLLPVRHAQHYRKYCLHWCAICFKWTKYNTIVVYTIHHRQLCTCMFIFKENVWVFCNIFDQ